MTDVTAAAQDGYRGDSDQRPAYDSSPDGMAYVAGMQHRLNGGQFPTRAKMGRGYSVYVNATLYHVDSPQCAEARMVIIGSRRAEAASQAVHV